MHLKYAPAVYELHLSKDKQELESVLCTKSWDDAYCDMLCILNIPPLSDGRKIGHQYKVVHGFVGFHMHHYCTSLALITSEDTHILSHSYNPRLSQILFYFFLFLTCYNNLEQFIILSCFITYMLACLRLIKTYLYDLGVLHY